jgi:hypothetical protein
MRTARELAAALLPQLEAIANIHYLLDKHVEDPDSLRRLRTLEEEVFESLLAEVERARGAQ